LFVLLNNGCMKKAKTHELWGHVHWLTVLAQQGSFTAAALRLGVSKAAVSQRLAELERQLGVALVQRTTRSVRLTEAGQRLVDETRSAFDHIAQSFAQVQELAGALRGRVRVTAPVALARQHLVPLLAQFLARHPQVQVELDLSDRLQALAREGYDLAIRHTATVPDTHVAWRLCATHSVLVASPVYLAQHGEPRQPADLQQHRCLSYPRPQELPAWTLRRISIGTAPEGEPLRETVNIQVLLAANNSEALRDAALAGLGIALLPDFSAQAALQTGQLRRVLPDWLPEGTFAGQIYALRPYSAHVPQAVQALVGFLREAMFKGFSCVSGGAS